MIVINLPMAVQPAPGLFAPGTHTLYRLSPLHFSDATSPFSEAGLRYHTRRLGTVLKGDVLHGEIELNKAGPYKSCKWTPLISVEPQAGHEADGSQDGLPENTTLEQLGGIRLDIDYEEARFTAFLLNKKTSLQITKDEVYLPLLEVWMPVTLRPVVTSYLSAAFDTRVESLKLSNWFMNVALEDLLQSLCSGIQAAGFPGLMDLRITIGFLKSTASSLKKMDITIRNEDIWGFLEYGRKAWKDETPFNYPLFWTALRAYLENNTGLKLDLSTLVIEKFDYAGFHVGADGKIIIASMLDSINNTEDDMEALTHAQQARAKLVERLIDAATLESTLRSDGL